MFRSIKDISLLRRFYYTLNAPLQLERFKPDLQEVVRKNRHSLSLVPRWIDDEIYRKSIFHYGLPPHIRSFIDDPIDDTASYSDLIVFLAKGFRNLRYLELGPSVGKNLFQLAMAVQNSDLLAVDIEDINPILEGRLHLVNRETWQSMAGSKRAAMSSQTTYSLESNRVEYIAGDLFDERTWDRLVGRTFNLIFSDAFHSPEALMLEWENISRRGLLADGPFAIVWDDLGSRGMRAAFFDIAIQILKARPTACASLELFQGWVGKRESPHAIGIVRSKETD